MNWSQSGTDHVLLRDDGFEIARVVPAKALLKCIPQWSVQWHSALSVPTSLAAAKRAAETMSRF